MQPSVSQPFVCIGMELEYERCGRRERFGFDEGIPNDLDVLLKLRSRRGRGREVFDLINEKRNVLDACQLGERDEQLKILQPIPVVMPRPTSSTMNLCSVSLSSDAR